ncbi:MAG: DUF3352 domain-containing protein, partial [Cyanobacteria bacterium P01_F01_bin.42]
LILGGGAAYFFFQNRGGSDVLPVGSRILPVDTSLSVTLTTQGDPRDRLQDFNIPKVRQAILKNLDAFDAEVLEPQGLNFRADVQPWVGASITTATLTPETNGSDAALAATSKVWILPMRDSGRARAFVTQGITRGGGTAESSIYQGQAIQSLRFQSDPVHFTALEDVVVIANDLPSMREVIDTAIGEESLASQERFKLAMAEISAANPLAVLYVNVPENTSQLFEQEGRQIDKVTLERLQEFQGFGSSVTLTENGLNFSSVSWLQPESEESLTVTGPAPVMASRLPADTLLMVSGESFQQVWNDYQKGVETQLLLPFSPRSLQANFTRLTGLNFEEKFFPWMTGEFAAGLVPSSPQDAKNAGVVFMVRASDQTRAEQVLRELEAEMQKKYALQISETKINDNSVVIWRLPPNLPIASRGWLGDRVMFFTMFSPVTERIVDRQESLADDQRYQAATQSQLSQKSGQFFLNVPLLVNVMDSSQFLPKLTPEYQNYTKEFESIGGTSTTLNDWSTRYDVNVNFVKK